MVYSLSWFDSVVPLWLSLGVVGLYLGGLVLCAEGLNRRFAWDAELTRKVVHIGTGHVILLAWWLQIPASVGLGAAVAAAAIALVSYFVPILPSINSVGRKSLGTFFYAVSMGSLVGWFWPLGAPEYAAIGILVMAWGDGLAALVGRHFGKHRYRVFGMDKSWEGSLAMAAASFGVTSLVLSAIAQEAVIPIALVVALCATGLEAVSQLGIDNLTVPLGSAALSFYLSQILF